MSDDRILGSGDFVERIIKEADAKIKYQLPVKEQDQKIDEFITKLCKNAKVSMLNIRSLCAQWQSDLNLDTPICFKYYPCPQT